MSAIGIVDIGLIGDIHYPIRSVLPLGRKMLLCKISAYEICAPQFVDARTGT
jgi:hypothetical protein